ncbi:Alpha/Beta hydrolase protein [Halenospora varia]|nr:Alpha/Beta hydrolase protein [Halenospora varia]
MTSPTYTSGTTSTKGCTLHFTTILPRPEEALRKPLFLLIPGGAGHTTYSRRQHGLSTLEPGTSYIYLNPVQQTRDILAVASALGFGSQKLYLFTNSGGGIYALQLAATHPERIAHLIVHETPTISLLPDSEQVIDFIHKIYSLYLSEGKEAVYELFRTQMPGYKDANLPCPPLAGGAEGDEERFLKYEFLPNLHLPDLRRVWENGVSVSVAYRKGSRDAFYVRTTIEQAAILGCDRFMVPGNHTGYRYEPEAFAARLLVIFGEMEEKERMRRVTI